MYKTKKQLIAKLSPICFFSLVSWGAVAHAAITPSAPAAGGPGVHAGASGSTVVNINAAGKGGVSHNVYTQFDVGSGGVVLNNSAVGSNSQLAGHIAGNANLVGGSASIILNEVNSTRASQLNGMMEVAGQKAQVIVANPSGITCSGCGFINTDRATLTTGKAQMANGTLLGYTVEKGTITINGNGLQASDVDYTDLISRAVKIDAELRADDLNITIGRNIVNADNTRASALAPAGGAPIVGIDVAKLGGMYANKITLVSTERGVGVRNAGTIGAAVGDLNITSDGILANIGTIASERHLNITGVRGSKNDSGRGLSNAAGAMIQATSNIKIDIANSKLSNHGIIRSDANITLASGDVDNKRGALLSKGILNMEHRYVNNAGGIIIGMQGVELSSNRIDNTNGVISSSDNEGNGDGDLNIYTAGNPLNNTGGTLKSSRELNLDVAHLGNHSGVISGKNNVLINGASLNNTAGLVSASNDLNINVQNGTLTNSGTLNGPRQTGLHSGEGGMTLIAGSINNANGQIKSRGDVVANTSSALRNGSGIIESAGNIVVKTNSLNNGKGEIKSGHDTLIAANSIANVQGNISADGQATLSLSGSYSHYGSLSGKQGINLHAEIGTVSNYGTLSSTEGLTTVNTRSFYNRRGAVVDSQAGLHLELGKSATFSNRGKINGPISISINQ
ncbi:filamentous hemagglutinin N-terminal domain-containing protein [Serratia fonticola]|uniref:filamentous hemagglutinin N-terminal domain-containing protein n=1 Tax=Serratia fonticola TaxID=47917 RepID=UPI002DBB581B|nr:filamentous hemagglutinin N-terminal domain-containing protein [Serratia fonticola]MEB7887312.1 filamentous hemagglutinin N-terminal domain-containing protein [Serratia fonticola]